MSKVNEKLDFMVGKRCAITLNDRGEHLYDGVEFLGSDNHGVLIAYTDHGREFFSYLPFGSITSIEHKVVPVEHLLRLLMTKEILDLFLGVGLVVVQENG